MKNNISRAAKKTKQNTIRRCKSYSHLIPFLAEVFIILQLV